MSSGYGYNLRRRRSSDSSSTPQLSKLPLEMLFQIFSYLDLPAVRAVRLVSKEWKLMVEVSRNLHFDCHLTDDTLLTAVNSLMKFASVKIHDFTGAGNKVVSSTRGTGRLIASTRRILFQGKKINAEEISKIMKYGGDSLEELIFKKCHKDILVAVIGTKLSFNCLKKLVISYKCFPRCAHTQVLHKLSFRQNVMSLPVLDHFKICYSLENVDDLYTSRYTPTAREVFTNYLAITKVILKFRSTLKTVEIVRNEVIRTALVLQVNTNQLQLATIEQVLIDKALEEFEGLSLEKLTITPLIDEGEYPWILESCMLKRQRNLKEVSINKKLCTPRLGNQSLETVLPLNISGFNFAHIALTCIGNAHIDMAIFAQCPNLKTLWLAFYRGVHIGPTHRNSLFFTNLESIPRGLKSLHLKSSQQDTIIIHQQSLLSRDQLRWLIDNMTELESFWAQLVTEQTTEPVGDLPDLIVDMEADGEDGFIEGDHALLRIPGEDQAEDLHAQEAHQLLNRVNQDMNANANVSVETFRDLLAMPKIRDLKLDMYNVKQMSAILELGPDGNPWILPMGTHVDLEDIRDYTQACEETAHLTFTTQTTTFFPFGFVELTIAKT